MGLFHNGHRVLCALHSDLSSFFRFRFSFVRRCIHFGIVNAYDWQLIPTWTHVLRLVIRDVDELGRSTNGALRGRLLTRCFLECRTLRMTCRRSTRRESTSWSATCWWTYRSEQAGDVAQAVATRVFSISLARLYITVSPHHGIGVPPRHPTSAFALCDS